MSDIHIKNSEKLATPCTQQVKKPLSYKQVYLNSMQRKKNNDHQCSLCLFFSYDCENFRCSNKGHYVCAECACDWEVDKVCPVCKRRSTTASWKKERSLMSFDFETAREKKEYFGVRGSLFEKGNESSETQSNLVPSKKTS